MKFFQNRNEALFNLVTAVLFVAIAGMVAMTSIEELTIDSQHIHISKSDLKKDPSGNRLSEKENLEEITEEYFNTSVTINYIIGLQTLLVNNFLLHSLPNCMGDIHTPPPKQIYNYSLA